LFSAFTGQFAHASDPQSKNGPNRGEAALYSGSSAFASAIEVMSGRSRQLTA
jgi:hypothetical protein